MPIILIDSNVLLDLMMPVSEWNPWSVEALRRAADESRLVINPIVYAEISVDYQSIELTEAALFPGIEREPIPYEAAFLAGKVYAEYRKRGGTKSSPLPDFFIGAHAAVAGYRLLTRDTKRYRTYFPKLELIAPD